MSRKSVYSQKDLHASKIEGDNGTLGSIERGRNELEVTAIGGSGGGTDLDDLYEEVNSQKNER